MTLVFFARCHHVVEPAGPLVQTLYFSSRRLIGALAMFAAFRATIRAEGYHRSCEAHLRAFGTRRYSEEGWLERYGGSRSARIA